MDRRQKAISQGNGYMTHDTFTDHESLLHVIAHELRHLWQKRVPKGRRVWRARGQFSERDADAYGTRIVRHWRRTSRNAHTQFIRVARTSPSSFANSASDNCIELSTPSDQ
jgi:hypothetical protein